MRLRRESGERWGTSAVEMAFVAPIFVSLVMGTIEMSRMGMVYQLLTTASREGCRVAVVPGAKQADVEKRVKAVLNGSGITISSVTPTLPDDPKDPPYSWNTAPGGTPITVSLSVPFKDVSWLGPTSPFPFLQDVKISASATMSSENP